MASAEKGKSRGLSVRILTLAAVILYLPAFTESAAFAQITGRVIGTVIHSDTGQPAVGAHVLVDGTSFVATTNNDGSYLIDEAPVGLHSMTVQYLSYQTTRDNLRILAGETMKVDFEVGLADQVGRTLKRARLVYRNVMTPEPRLATYAQNMSVREITELGVGVYPHPQMLPVPGIHRPVTREEIGSYLAVGLDSPGRRQQETRGNLQPRLQVQAWPEGNGAAGGQSERGRAKSDKQ